MVLHTSPLSPVIADVLQGITWGTYSLLFHPRKCALSSSWALWGAHLKAFPQQTKSTLNPAMSLIFHWILLTIYMRTEREIWKKAFLFPRSNSQFPVLCLPNPWIPCSLCPPGFGHKIHRPTLSVHWRPAIVDLSVHLGWLLNQHL